MNLELPFRTVALVVAFLLVSLGLALFMFARLGTVSLPGTYTRTVRTVLANAEGLPVQADVLVHGVKVGSVSGISVERDGRTVVTLTLDSGAPVLRPDATAQVGFKTPLGEAFVDLDPGHAAGRLVGPVRSEATVELDDALAFLDAGGRANARAALLALGRGATPADTSAEVSGTLAQLDTATDELGQLMSELSAQRSDLTGIVENGHVVLGVLAGRSGELRQLTADADTTLSAVAAQRTALAATLAQLPSVLSAATGTLLDARPVIGKATPLLGDLDSAAPALTAALNALPASTHALESVLGHARQLDAAAVPALRLLRALAGPGDTALTELGRALADIVPVAQFLGPRGHTIAAWFANTADLGSHGDAKGDWARFFVMFDPSTFSGSPSGAPPGNSYTAPGDAAHNQPYRPGDYQRLEPYWPALGDR